MSDTQDFVPASVGKRCMAFLVDTAIVSGLLNLLFLLVALVVISFIGIPSEEDIQWKLHEMGMRGIIFALVGIVAFVLLAATIWHGYFVYFEHRYRRTPGKKVYSLQVISLDNQPLTFKQAMMREIFRSYIDLPFVFPGIVTILCSKKHQRVGDMVSNTLVVYSPKVAQDAQRLYLSGEQYDLRSAKYKVLDTTLEEANRFLKTFRPVLTGEMDMARESNVEFANRILIAQDPSFVDEEELRLRFLAEYLLQARREVL